MAAEVFDWIGAGLAACGGVLAVAAAWRAAFANDQALRLIAQAAPFGMVLLAAGMAVSLADPRVLPKLALFAAAFLLMRPMLTHALAGLLRRQSEPRA